MTTNLKSTVVQHKGCFSLVMHIIIKKTSYLVSSFLTIFLSLAYEACTHTYTKSASSRDRCLHFHFHCVNYNGFTEPYHPVCTLTLLNFDPVELASRLASPADNRKPFNSLTHPHLPLKVQSSWAGYYEYNTLDQNAVIGAHPIITNLVFANGFSGHGIQQAPAAGRAVSEVILDGRSHSIELEDFSFDRVIAKRPLRERNVV